jgi:hypothetical protein
VSEQLTAIELCGALGERIHDWRPELTVFGYSMETR